MSKLEKQTKTAFRNFYREYFQEDEGDFDIYKEEYWDLYIPFAKGYQLQLEKIRMLTHDNHSLANSILNDHILISEYKELETENNTLKQTLRDIVLLGSKGIWNSLQIITKAEITLKDSK